MRSTLHERRVTGFTLIEVLIALTIFSVVMLSALTIFRGASQSWRRGELQTDLMQRARGVAEQIARQLAAAVATPWGSVRFEGTAEAVYFVTVTPREGRSDLLEVGFWREGETLFYHYDTAPDFDFDTGESEAMAGGVASLAFAYSDGAAWQPAWDSAQAGALPKAVEVTVGLTAGGATQTYVTVVQLRTNS
jgi:type II secretion system protein J